MKKSLLADTKIQEMESNLEKKGGWCISDKKKTCSCRDNKNKDVSTTRVSVVTEVYRTQTV